MYGKNLSGVLDEFVSSSIVTANPPSFGELCQGKAMVALSLSALEQRCQHLGMARSL